VLVGFEVCDCEFEAPSCVANRASSVCGLNGDVEPVDDAVVPPVEEPVAEPVPVDEVALEDVVPSLGTAKIKNSGVDPVAVPVLPTAELPPVDELLPDDDDCGNKDWSSA
jgi:hypothetical protein